MDLPRGHFTAVTGDGSFSTLVWPNDYRLTLDRVADALVPGGRLVVRCYIAPDEPESLAQIADDVLARRAASFYSARWRIAMALAAGGNVAVPAIRQAFDLAFPDRSALSLATGWDRETIDEIDAYLDSDLVYSFLTRTQIVETLTDRFTDSRFVSSGNYPMAEHYPLLVADRRG
jgi:hypothetical protein